MSTAGERWAAMDFDATDGLSVDELGIDYGWPEPGDCCLDVLATAQLYWPRLNPWRCDLHGHVFVVGEARCVYCYAPYEPPYEPVYE